MGYQARCERGYTELLPDLAVWLKRSEPPVAVIAESGGRREDRQKMILEGWRDAILSGRYTAVHYHCASASVAHWISRLANKVRLSGPTFVAAVQMSAEEIAALSPAAPETEADFDETRSSARPEVAPDEQARVAAAGAPASPEPVQVAPREPQQAAEPETSEAVAERERAYREIFGLDEQKPRRRWRHGRR